ncbi:hypothetical protein [Pedobacter sp. Leaf176]|uniref:hypothetical protein n=1 Tax=Pedobacter sp. Leaf176 TaxID=1736286 RepID=UPI00070188B2|nr:hypothetical protein [Pedobacter sp. Leaf176]KQR67235.1 hypothetical protein ASF92_16120 [Pedobacter sp. Leaf176]
MKYLSIDQLKANLRLGKGIEQWLGHEVKDGYVVLKWIRIEKESPIEYTVGYIECFDEGGKDFVDIYEFSLLDPDFPFGIVNSFPSIEDAIDFSVKQYGASIEKFVSESMIQDEYINYLAQTGQSPNWS